MLTIRDSKVQYMRQIQHMLTIRDSKVQYMRQIQHILTIGDSSYAINEILIATHIQAKSRKRLPNKNTEFRIKVIVGNRP